MVLVLLFLKRKLFWSSTVYKCSSHCTLHWENSDTCHSCNTFMLRCVYGWVKSSRIPSPISSRTSSDCRLIHWLRRVKTMGLFFHVWNHFTPRDKQRLEFQPVTRLGLVGVAQCGMCTGENMKPVLKEGQSGDDWCLHCSVMSRTGFWRNGVGFLLISLSWETKQKILKGALAIF